MNEFKSINSLKNSIGVVRRHCIEKAMPLPILTMHGRVKLHGTNMGVHRTLDGEFIPQSRGTTLVEVRDHYGFANFVEKNIEYIKPLFKDYIEGEDVVLFGEWVGGSIQKKVALKDCPKHWVLLYALVDGQYEELALDMQDNEHGIYNLNQIPSYEVTVDFRNPAAASDVISDLTLAVEEECPWAKHMFGVSGIGEGIVWHPKHQPHWDFAWFKTKGVKHDSVQKGRKIRIEDNQLESKMELAELVLPEWRLEQGITHLRESNLPIDSTSTGPYIKWISQDVLKEEMETITESGFDWKGVQSVIISAARDYYFKQIEQEFKDGEG